MREVFFNTYFKIIPKVEQQFRNPYDKSIVESFYHCYMHISQSGYVF